MVGWRRPSARLDSPSETPMTADSGNSPGAASTLNPYVAAARFVLSGSDLDRNVKQTAVQIAERVIQRLRESGPVSR